MDHQALADGIVVRSEIKRINQLKGKVLTTAQFTEADFFIRYLAQEAGLEINAIGSLDATPHPAGASAAPESATPGLASSPIR